ncbi:uncharacterized protein LOC144353200 [Saccoglossus kowalevskii]
MAQRLTPEMREVYNSIIQEQLNRDFIEKIVDDDPKRGHYIPHHPVEKQSSTTPIRVVYNCSAKYRDQPSLNECLETGPSINNDLVKMLLRFRTHKIGDIVLVHSDTQKRLLWPLAKVEKLHVGNDGLVRAADIRTKTGKTSRPLCKLYPLELSAVENTSDDGNADNETRGKQIPPVLQRPQRNAAAIAKLKIQDTFHSDLCDN